jgi:hypothetical protein
LYIALIITFQLLSLFTGLFWASPLPARAAVPGSNINVLPAYHFTLTGLPGSVVVGVEQTVTVTVYDSSDNVVPGYTGTVVFTSTDDQAALPSNYTFTGTDAGVHSFKATFKTSGSWNLVVTDSVNGTIKGTALVNVTAGASVQFEVKYTCCTNAGDTRFSR